MVLIVMFLAGFYLGIVVLSLLVMTRKSANANNQPMVKFPIMYRFYEAERMMRVHRARSTGHAFIKTENIL